MPAPTHNARWSVLVVLIGAVVAAVVYAVSADVVWTIVPLLMTVAAVRRIRRGGGAPGMSVSTPKGSDSRACGIIPGVPRHRLARG